MRVRPARTIAPLLLSALLSTGAARGQEAPSPEARVHFERAVALFEAGDASGALAEFERAYELSRRASVLYNIGASLQAMHDYPRAIEALRRFLAESDGRQERQRALATRALAQMAPLVARLHLAGAPAGAAVTLDGRAVGSDLLTVGPGAHRLVASAAGYLPREVELTVVSGDDRTVDLTLAPEAPPAPAVAAPPVVVAPPAPSPAPVAPPAPRPGRAVFWSMVITGGALALGATIVGVAAVTTQGDYASHHADDPTAPGIASRGRALALTADLLALGALGAGTAALVLGLQSAPRRPAPVRVTLAPRADGAMLVGFGAF